MSEIEVRKRKQSLSMLPTERVRQSVNAITDLLEVCFVERGEHTKVIKSCKKINRSIDPEGCAKEANWKNFR